MLFVGIIITSILAIQTMQTALSPATLRVMATLQAHRARAIANALRARAHYNALRSRTNLGLLDHRVIRNSGDQFGDDTDFEYDEDNFPFVDDDYEEITLPEAEEDLARFLPLHSKLQSSQNGLEGFVGANKGFVNVEHQMNHPDSNVPYTYNNLRENKNPGDNTLRIPSNIDELNELATLNCGEIDGHRGPTPLGCQRPYEQPNSPVAEDDPALGMQTPYPQGFPGGPSQFGQQMFVPWQFGIPAMQFVPQGNPFQNYAALQPMPGLPPGFSPQMVFLRQASLGGNDKSKLHDSQKPSLESTIGSTNPESPNVGAFSHTHSYTHSHTHFKEPNQNIKIPSTQIVTPNLNLHVVQNQNAAVIPPQQIATATVHPGFSTGRIKPVQINYGSNIYPNPIPTFALNGGVNQAGQNSDYLVPGFNSNQCQVIHTNAPTETQHLFTPNRGGTTFTQSQTLNQGGRLEKPMVGMGLRLLPYSNLGQDTEQVGTTMTDFRMRAPESPEHFDPNQPQNLQPVVNYIERQEGNMRRLVKSIEANENQHRHFGEPLGSRAEFEFIRSPNGEEERENVQDERLGTFPLENIHINPPPTLPENFLQLNAEERRKAMENLLHEEQTNFEDFLEQVDENNRRILVDLSTMMETGPAFMASPNDIPAEITGNSRYDLEKEAIGSTMMENDLEVQEKPIDTLSDANSYLGHIIDVPERQEFEWYQRLARSLNGTSGTNLDKLLSAEKNIINELKKDAKHDEDLMMIGYIGDNMIKDLEERKNETKRSKRDIGGSHYLPLNRFIVDPMAKLDIPRTLDNLGAVVKNTFEHEKAPLYHVRNMMGSAQDAMLATMKIPTENFLIPSQYDIVRRQGNAGIVGDINPNLFSERYSQNKDPSDDVTNTFQKVGSAVRGSVLSGQEALSHVGQVANHAKNAIHNTRYTAPRLLLRQLPVMTREPIRKAVLITPRIFDVANEDIQVGNALDNSRGQFVKVGHILDSIGVSNPNSNNVHFEKIILERPASIFHTTDKSKPSQMLENLLGKVRVEDFNGIEEENLLGNTVKTLDDVKESFGVNSLKGLFDSVKNKLKNVLGETVHNQIVIPNGHDAQIVKHGEIHSQDKNHMHQNEEVVKASMIPDSLVQPFMGHFPQNEIDQWNKAGSQKFIDENERARRLGQILGSINPVMFEKLFNESISAENAEISHDSTEENSSEKDGEDVGTSMVMSGAMLKPFMGQASSKLHDDFFHKYMPDAGKTDDDSDATAKPEWMEMDMNQGNEVVENEE